MATQLPGDKLKVEVDGSSYSGTLKLDSEGQLAVVMTSMGLSKAIRDSVNVPKDINITYGYGSNLQFTPEEFNETTDSLIRTVKGFTELSYGTIDNNNLEIGGQLDLDCHIQQLIFSKEVDVDGNLERFKGSITLSISGFEAINRNSIFRILDMDTSNLTMEGTSPTGVTLAFDTVFAEGLYNKLVTGQQYAIDFTLLDASKLPNNTTYYFVENGVVNQNFTIANVTGIDVQPKFVIFTFDSDVVMGGDTLTHTVVNSVGTALEDNVPTTITIREDDTGKVYSQVSDSAINAMFNQANVAAIYGDYKHVATAYPALKYNMTPRTDDIGNPTWLPEDEIGVDNTIKEALDSWADYPSDQLVGGHPWFEELYISPEANGIYLNDTAYEMIGEALTLGVMQLSDAGDKRISITYEAVVGELYSRPFVRVLDGVNDKALHSFADWCRYCLKHEITLTFDMEITDGNVSPEERGNCLVRLDKVSDGYAASLPSKIGVCKFKTFPEKPAVQPLNSIHVNSQGFVKAEYYTENAKVGVNIVFRYGQQVLVSALVNPSVNTPYWNMSSNNSLLSSLLVNSVDTGMLLLNVTDHEPLYPYTLYGSKATNEEIGFERVNNPYGSLILDNIDGLLITGLKAPNKDANKVLFVFDVDATSITAVGRNLTIEDQYGNRETATVVLTDGVPVAEFVNPAIVAAVKGSEEVPYGFNLSVTLYPELSGLYNLLEKYIAAVNNLEDNTPEAWLRIQTYLFEYHLGTLLLEEKLFFVCMENAHLRVSQEPFVFDIKRLFVANHELDATNRMVKQFEAWLSVVLLGSDKYERSEKVRHMNVTPIIKRFIDNDDQMQMAAWLNYLKI